MADLDILLRDDAPTKKKDIDALLADDSDPTVSADVAPSMSAEERAARLKETQQFGKPRELPWYERAAQGFVDPVLGAGQLMQNILPDAALNAGRKLTDPLVNAVAGGDINTSDTSTADFNRNVRNREGAYQGRRAEAGQDGIDFARIAGTLANPISWYGPVKGGGAGIMAGVKAGAAAGAFQALLQPVNSEGSFLFDKGMQVTLGGAFGGGLGGAFAALRPIAGKAVDFVKSLKGGGSAQQAAAAAQATDDILTSVGADPARVDPVIRQTMSREVLEASELGVQPDPIVMTNRADASALPVPVELSRGMASRDAFQYSWEQNTSKLVGKGEPIAETIRNANRNLIQNLDELGAKGARSTYDFSQQAIAHLKATDDALEKGVSDAYKAVRNSSGQSALLNHKQFVDKAFERLRAEGLGDILPTEVRDTLNALQLGRSPLSVEMAQSLDKAWTGLQKGNNESKARAIEIVKQALFKADVADDVGAASMQAYRQAKSLAKARFDLHDANPALKAVVNGKAEPEKFFQQYVLGSNASQLEGFKQLLGPDLVKAAQGTMVRQLKRKAIGAASDENAIFSQANYNSLIQDDVMGPRIRTLFSDVPETLGNLYRVGRVAENVFKFPQGHSVNTSNAAIAGANMIEEALGSAASRNTIGGLIQFGRDYSARKAEEQTIREAARAGVTAAPLRRPPPSRGQARVSDLLSRGAAAAAPEEDE